MKTVLRHCKAEIFINTFDLTDWKLYFDFTLKTTVKSENGYIYMHTENQMLQTMKYVH